VLNAHGVHDVRQMDIHTAEPLVPEPSLVEVGIAIGMLKMHKSPAELINAGNEILRSKIHKLILFKWNKEQFHSSGRNLLLHQFIRSAIRLPVIITKESPLIHCVQYLIQNSVQVNSICQ
jgi:hypothetical protein